MRRLALVAVLVLPAPAWAAPPLPTLTFTASPIEITTGGVTTLTWTSTRAKSCQASDGWSGTLPTSGTEIRAGLDTTTKFTLTCTGRPGRSITQSVLVTVVAIPPPPPPGVLMLQWQDNATNETGFIVERRTTETFAPIATLGADVTSYQDTPLTTGTYCYRVFAFNAAGQSGYTNEACGVIP